MNPKKLVFLFSFLIIVFIIVEVQQIVADRDQKMLTAAEIKKSIYTKYLGKIEDIKLSKKAENKMYIVDLQGQKKDYTLKVDAYSGEILHLTQLKERVPENSEKIAGNEIASFSTGEKGDEKLVNRKTFLELGSLDCSVEIMKEKLSIRDHHLNRRKSPRNYRALLFFDF
jgi:hypothetical protein